MTLDCYKVQPNILEIQQNLRPKPQNLACVCLFTHQYLRILKGWCVLYIMKNKQINKRVWSSLAYEVKIFGKHFMRQTIFWNMSPIPVILASIGNTGTYSLFSKILYFCLAYHTFCQNVRYMNQYIVSYTGPFKYPAWGALLEFKSSFWLFCMPKRGRNVS